MKNAPHLLLILLTLLMSGCVQRPVPTSSYIQNQFPEAAGLPEVWRQKLLHEPYLGGLPYFQHVLSRLRHPALPTYAPRETVLKAASDALPGATLRDIYFFDDLLILTYQVRAQQAPGSFQNIFNCFVYRVSSGETGALLMVKS